MGGIEETTTNTQYLPYSVGVLTVTGNFSSEQSFSRTSNLSVLKANGINFVHHYAPLHYLPFIARSRVLMCKPSLAQEGFGPKHLRSKSSKQDQARGFGKYAFLTLDEKARILKAKLQAGFPHIGIKIPSEAVETTEYSLCRYNVAMTRYLRRGESPGFEESASNGRYYGKQQIPVARTQSDKLTLLQTHLPKKTMIEVLIDGDLPLPDETEIICFSLNDKELADSTLEILGRPWATRVIPPPGPYQRSNQYVSEVVEFIAQAIKDEHWRGNGLEFDRV